MGFCPNIRQKYDHTIRLKQNIENSHDECLKLTIKCTGIEYKSLTSPAGNILLLGQVPKFGKFWYFPYVAVYCRSSRRSRIFEDFHPAETHTDQVWRVERPRSCPRHPPYSYASRCHLQGRTAVDNTVKNTIDSFLDSFFGHLGNNRGHHCSSNTAPLRQSPSLERN